MIPDEGVVAGEQQTHLLFPVENRRFSLSWLLLCCQLSCLDLSSRDLLVS